MWNLPNALTLCRLFLIPVYGVVFASGYIKSAFFVLLAAGITDVLDGYWARRHNQVTALGSMLDPLADKLMMLTVILSLVFSGMISWLAAAAIFLRDAGMIVGSAFFHFRGKKTVPANALGKLTTVLYYVAILLIVFQLPFAAAYLWFVIIVSFVASGLYILQFQLLNKRKAEP
ncbi:CDP-diacylglycerol--glycerol-3-phosphate 3-phosphatidyltransferase [Paenibacillus sp. UNCCL117]|uniref:CDP-alcohol phosphatidyltransferase family protein n=1 Tax=unclassified Paenibacillus TaxID=185978 RepID=UPI00088EB7FD|nr:MULTISPECIES: CDP-alcohol phosphatidyltransferase family protein [unclassified Paenibacillus]SDE34632.1 CDP-diacylglycerol--glycerol-3-phosphate 3-phosphatidyltransferase [Paenibacillus sp. cl123]SFW64320.1 CDP-diacylglycerol--glycerol-3-phosphate 3-phosphatidyltransferase [Paenibacillus sp. UNCCL117]